MNALDVDGLAAVRDLGGLPRVDGSVTPAGVFYRAANVDRVTPGGWERVRAAGIRTVVDLRRADERDGDTGARPDWLHTVHVDLDGFDDVAFWAHYLDNGMVGTALYYLPHLAAMPERSVQALPADGSPQRRCSGSRPGLPPVRHHHRGRLPRRRRRAGPGARARRGRLHRRHQGCAVQLARHDPARTRSVHPAVVVAAVPGHQALVDQQAPQCGVVVVQLAE